MDKVNTGAKRTVSMNLALTPEDKKFIKMYALRHDKSVADVIQEYIQQLRKKDEKE